MNDENFKLSESFVDKAYIRQAQEARRRREKMFRTLLSNVSGPLRCDGPTSVQPSCHWPPTSLVPFIRSARVAEVFAGCRMG
jgi:hypothetical protein